MRYVLCVYGVLFTIVMVFQGLNATMTNVLLVTKRTRPQLGPRDYVIVGHDKKTDLWTSFMLFNEGISHQENAVKALQFWIGAECTLELTQEGLAHLLADDSKHIWYQLDNRRAGIYTYVLFIRPYRIARFKRLVNRFQSEECGLPLDEIAMIRWENIETMLRSNSNCVYAHINSVGAPAENYHQIMLSPQCIAAIRPFFLRRSYRLSEDEKTRIYL